MTTAKTLETLRAEALKALKQFYKAENVATKRIACDKLNLIIFKTANTFKCTLIEAQKLLKLED